MPKPRRPRRAQGVPLAYGGLNVAHSFGQSLLQLGLVILFPEAMEFGSTRGKLLYDKLRRQWENSDNQSSQDTPPEDGTMNPIQINIDEKAIETAWKSAKEGNFLYEFATIYTDQLKQQLNSKSQYTNMIPVDLYPSDLHTLTPKTFQKLTASAIQNKRVDLLITSFTAMLDTFHKKIHLMNQNWEEPTQTYNEMQQFMKSVYVSIDLLESWSKQTLTDKENKHLLRTYVSLLNWRIKNLYSMNTPSIIPTNSTNSEIDMDPQTLLLGSFLLLLALCSSRGMKLEPTSLLYKTNSTRKLPPSPMQPDQPLLKKLPPSPSERIQTVVKNILNTIGQDLSTDETAKFIGYMTQHKKLFECLYNPIQTNDFETQWKKWIDRNTLSISDILSNPIVEPFFISSLFNEHFNPLEEQEDLTLERLKERVVDFLNNERLWRCDKLRLINTSILYPKHEFIEKMYYENYTKYETYCRLNTDLSSFDFDDDILSYIIGFPEETTYTNQNRSFLVGMFSHFQRNTIQEFKLDDYAPALFKHYLTFFLSVLEDSSQDTPLFKLTSLMVYSMTEIPKTTPLNRR
jgi:hypothetical protein